MQLIENNNQLILSEYITEDIQNNIVKIRKLINGVDFNKFNIVIYNDGTNTKTSNDDKIIILIYPKYLELNQQIIDMDKVELILNKERMSLMSLEQMKKYMLVWSLYLNKIIDISTVENINSLSL